ncbi:MULTISPECIES: phage major capsid protein [unclassified Mesorhizobium]|uniref:phage major capsid protein n=1 Tax=unclassified Mesorhizobium TaxID=325217 RepID=UPI00112ADFD7|nr:MULTISPECIES: phage major capsid protein [unclassified Mesorhizobium]TPJ38184.1 phage major capsid protein [Mesorhizobium sp. B2-6-6]MCA0000955.1 phage major capsid protein [Mesorhizobium sp. B264B2A]MCA0004704.1 phage major capsid protein [Mesorhizobium sp. B264B1B]MCA0019097.1 phage major capsid protein [Mesorhizobium sp. B264B1A]TPJ52722.1 phage major capsid protein [Mesorhizobium sp. B2-6-4]
MATPSTIFTQMVSSTMRNVATEVADNVSKHTPVLKRMKQKGKILSGGYEIQIPLEYAENETYQRYSGFDTLNTNASDILTSAKYDWAQIALHIVSSGKELRQNSSKEKMVPLVKTKKGNALRTATNNFSVDMFSDGSLANQVGGFAHLIQTNGQGTVAGLDSSQWTFWQNKFREMTGTNAYTKDTILGEMNLLWMDTTNGADHTDLIVFSHDLFSVYEASQQQFQRYMDADLAETGFKSYKYKTADVVFDENANFTTTAEKGYFLNTDYLYLFQHKDAQWSMDDEKKPVNQDAVVIPLLWMGNFACSNRSRQGVLLDAA